MQVGQLAGGGAHTFIASQEFPADDVAGKGEFSSRPPHARAGCRPHHDVGLRTTSWMPLWDVCASMAGITRVLPWLALPVDLVGIHGLIVVLPGRMEVPGAMVVGNTFFDSACCVIS